MKYISSLLIFFSLFLFTTEISAETTWLDDELIFKEQNFKKIATYENILPNKTWTVLFSEDIDPTSISNESFFIVDSYGEAVNNFFINDGKRAVTILPPQEGYRSETYWIYMTTHIQSKNGTPLPHGSIIEFSIQEQDNSFMKKLTSRFVDPNKVESERNLLNEKYIHSDVEILFSPFEETIENGDQLNIDAPVVFLMTGNEQELNSSPYFYEWIKKFIRGVQFF